jgi:hypothetical protein
MNKLSTMLSLTVLCLAMTANAQQPAPATAPASNPPVPASDPPAPASDPPAPAAAPKKPPKTTAQSEAGEPRANTSRTPATARPPAGPAGPAQKAPGAADRLELGTATVTGDREQPKVMYIVPWKKSDIGDLAGKPMNSLVDEILAPVDRDVFKREVVYYKAVQADASQNGAPGRSPQQVEK